MVDRYLNLDKWAVGGVAIAICLIFLYHLKKTQNTNPKKNSKSRLHDKQRLDHFMLNSKTESKSPKIKLNKDHITQEPFRSFSHQPIKRKKNDTQTLFVKEKIKNRPINKAYDAISDSNLFSRVLHVTLTDKSLNNTKNLDNATFLSEISNNTTLKNQNISIPLLNRDNIDLAIIERLNKPLKQSSFLYFIECFERIFEEEKEIEFIRDEEEFNKQHDKFIFLKEQISLFCCRVFDANLTSENDFKLSVLDLKKFMRSSENERRFPKGFLKLFVNNCEDIDRVFGDFLDSVCKPSQAFLSHLQFDFSNELNILIKLCSNERTALLVIKHATFLLDDDLLINGRQFSLKSLLGAYLSFVSDNNQQLNQIFPDLINKSSNDMRKMEKEYISLINSLNNQIFIVCDALIRIETPKCAKTPIKNTFLTFISKAISLNFKRSQSYSNSSLLASDTFCLNLCHLMLNLSRPICISRKSKMDRIDARFFVFCSRINFKNFTRFGSQSQFNDFKSKYYKKDQKFFNLISEFVCLTHTAICIGFCASLSRLEIFENQISVLKRQLNSDLLKNHFEYKYLLTRTMALRSQLRNPNFIDRMIEFFEFTCKWLTFLFSQNSDFLYVLPEFMVTNMIEFYEFAIRDSIIKLRLFSNLSRIKLESFFRFSVDFMSPKSPLHNFHLRARFLDILMAFVPHSSVYKGREHANLCHPFNKNEYLCQNLVPTLITLYVDIEKSNRSSAFYEKFPFRRSIVSLFEFCLSFSPHNMAFDAYKTQNRSQFLRFINMLLNDTVFQSEEGFKYLEKIFECEKNASSNSNHEFELFENRCLYSFVLLEKSVWLLNWLSVRHRKELLSDDFIGRMAIWINVVVRKLSSEESEKLKVKTPKKYKFDLISLLKQTILIFNNLGHSNSFLDRIIEDKLYYDDKYYSNAEKILIKDFEIQDMKRFKMNLEKLKLRVLEHIPENIFDNAPTKYLDSLLNTLMENPVRLPSGNYVDLANARRLIMDKQEDPFNRQYLDESMLKSENELKLEILKWKKECIDLYKEKNKSKN